MPTSLKDSDVDDAKQQSLTPGEQALHDQREAAAGKSSLSSGQLDDLEKSYAAPAFTPEHEEKSALQKSGATEEGGNNIPFRKEKPKRLDNFKKKVKGLGKKKWFLAGVGGGGLLMVGLVMLMLLIGAQLIPNFAQNMVAYSFARVARETMDSGTEVTAEKIAIDSSSDNAYEKAAGEFANDTDKTTNENLWSKINKYRPEKVVDNMRASGQMYFEYGPDQSLNPLNKILGRQTIHKIYINGEAIDITKNSMSTLDKLLNPIDYTKSLWQTNKLIKTSLADSLDTTLRGTNYIIRSKVAGIIRDALDIKLYRWDQDELNKYASDTDTQADVQNEEESVDIATDDFQAGTEAEEGLTAGSKEQQAADAANQDLQNCASNTKCMQQVIDNGGSLPSSTVGILNKIFDPSILDTIIKLVGPTYAIAAPLCMIYEGSIVNSGGSINANSAELQRTAYQVTSAADQQKYGNVNGNAIGAQARQMGTNSEVANSNVMRRASGIPVDTTTSGVDPQRSAGGTYTYDVFSFLGPTADGIIRPAINTVCSVFDNMWTGILIGVATLLFPPIRAAIGSVGEAAGAGVAALAGTIAKELGNTILQMFTKKELAKMLVIGGATIAGSLLAKYVTLQHIGALNNGMSRNQDFDNRAEAGSILNAQDIDRQQNMAAPMTASGTAQTKTLDTGYITQQEQSKSAFQRYFAVTNASSFVSQLGVLAWAHMNLDTVPSILLSAGRIFNPVTAFSSVFNLMQNKSLAAASTTTDTTDYNILQWGWTPIEEWHYLNDSNYSMLYNQNQLNQSGQEQAISQKYMKCFTEQTGTLLAAGDLQRDSNGNIITNAGLCAPDNLTPLNRDDPNVTDKLVFLNQTAALVFRWRVAIRNQNGLNQLSDTANATVTE